MRILGMDYGSATLGISVSDESKTIASPIKTIRYKSMDDLLTEIDSLFKIYKFESIVLGNPINLDGSISKRSEETFKFKSILESRYNIPVILEDERLTTVIAENVLISNNTSRKNRKKVIDKMASALILQSYLDRK